MFCFYGWRACFTETGSLRPRTGSTAAVGVCGRGLGAYRALSQLELAPFNRIVSWRPGVFQAEMVRMELAPNRETGFTRPGLFSSLFVQMELAPFRHFVQRRPGLLPEGLPQMELAPFGRPIGFWTRSPKTFWTAQPRVQRRQGVCGRGLSGCTVCGRRLENPQQRTPSAGCASRGRCYRSPSATPTGTAPAAPPGSHHAPPHW